MKKDNRNVKTLTNFRTTGPFVLQIGMNTNYHLGVVIIGNYVHCDKYLINYSWKKKIEMWKHFT